KLLERRFRLGLHPLGEYPVWIADRTVRIEHFVEILFFVHSPSLLSRKTSLPVAAPIGAHLCVKVQRAMQQISERPKASLAGRRSAWNRAHGPALEYCGTTPTHPRL